MQNTRPLKKPWLLGAAIVSLLLLAAGIPFVRRLIAMDDDGAPRFHACFDLSRDGRRLVFTALDSGRQRLYGWDRGTNRVYRLTASHDVETEPALSPDGRWVYYAAAPAWDQPFHIFRVRTQGGAGDALTSGPNTDHDPSVSPDGKTLAFARATTTREYSMGGTAWDDYYLYRVGSDGRNPRPVDRTSYFSLSAPVFAPDGRSVFYAVIPHGGEPPSPDRLGRLFRVPLDGSGPAQDISFPRSTANVPRFSPDGRLAAVSSSEFGQYTYDLYVKRGAAPFPGTALHLTGDCPTLHNPRFTPHGKTILYFQGDHSYGTPESIWEVNSDGTHNHRIASHTLFSDPLHWKPEQF